MLRSPWLLLFHAGGEQTARAKRLSNSEIWLQTRVIPASVVGPPSQGPLGGGAVSPPSHFCLKGRPLPEGHIQVSEVELRACCGIKALWAVWVCVCVCVRVCAVCVCVCVCEREREREEESCLVVFSCGWWDWGWGGHTHHLPQKLPRWGSLGRLVGKVWMATQRATPCYSAQRRLLFGVC